MHPVPCLGQTRYDAPYEFSRIDHQQGLSHSAVFCFFQNLDGLMWLGTYDGVNCYDGRSIEVFRSDFSLENTFNNNVIHSISRADGDNLWISTYLGVNRMSPDRGRVVGSYDFKDYTLHSNTPGQTWIIAQDSLYYYSPRKDRFIKVWNASVPKSDNIETRSFVNDKGVLCVFPDKGGGIIQFSVGNFDREPSSDNFSQVALKFHSKDIRDIFYQNDQLCFIDADGDLYLYDIAHKTKIFFRNLSGLLPIKDKIVGIVPFDEDIIIAFQTHGLVRVGSSKSDKIDILERNVRIFSIYHDSRQGLLWVATDGEGAVICSKKRSVASNILFSSLSPNINRQVRSIMTDVNGDLWFGTKGDGLIHIPDYMNNGYKTEGVEVISPDSRCGISAYRKWDKEFHVYSLRQSKFYDGFWVGTGTPGLFFYSYDSGRLEPVTEFDDSPVIETHEIIEADDTTLYLSTADVGFQKVNVSRDGGGFSIKGAKRYSFFYEQKELSTFYPMVAQGDSVIWLGSRGQGLVRFDRKTEEYKVISLKRIFQKPVDDILSLHIDDDGILYVGTTAGLVVYPTFPHRHPKYIGRNSGLLNDMIHGILKDKEGALWLSTNRGLVKYNPEIDSFHTYYYTAGMQVGEFSDDAYYKCPYSGNLFFGGLEGLVRLDDGDRDDNSDNYPDILLRGLTIGHKPVAISDYLDGSVEDGLFLRNGDDNFTLRFAVPDYLSANDIEYSFKLEGYDAEWSPYSNVNEVSYADLPPGKYVLKVKYKKDVFDNEKKFFSIPIHLSAPWYLSIWARMFYAIIALGLAGAFAIWFWSFNRRRKEDRFKNSLMAAAEGRNMSDHLSVLYNACDRLRDENIPSEERVEAIDCIRETIMASIIGPADLRGEDYHTYFPNRFVVAAEMVIPDMFVKVKSILRKRGVDCENIVTATEGEIVFPVYKNALYSILYHCFNIVSREGKGEKVEVGAFVADGRLDLRFGGNAVAVGALRESLESGYPVDNNGNTDIRFSWRMLAEFVQSALESIGAEVRYDAQVRVLDILFPAADIPAHEEGKRRVILLENREELVWMVSNLLADEYDVVSVGDVETAFKEIENHMPVLFIADITLFAGREDECMEVFRRNRTILSGIPFIPMLSWNVRSATQRELILWADSYLTLPYDILFLRELAYVAVNGKRESRQMYLNELGSFASNISCTTHEQSEFIYKVLQYIVSNLKEETLGAPFIAECMNMSQRNFYRRLKEVSDLSVGDLIRNYRMEKAARLLRENELSIQSVIDEVGISSRSYFYKEFKRIYGMSPKEYRGQQG